MEHNKELTEENFKHPQPEEFAGMLNFKGECQFAFNSNLSGMRLEDIPTDVVLLFEADGAWNLTGTSELLATRYREKGYIAILSVDQTTANYWYYMSAARMFTKDGKHMYYVEPRWK